MLVLRNRRQILALHMATASTSLTTLLTAPPYDGTLITSSAFGPHDFPAPRSACWNWPLAIVVRNPYDRLISLWHKAVRETDPLGYTELSFEDYVLTLPTRDLWTIDRWLGNREPQTILRFEHLAEDLSQWLGQPVTLPHCNASVRTFRNWRHYYQSADVIQAAASWALADCQRFGYPRWPHAGQPPGEFIQFCWHELPD